MTDPRFTPSGLYTTVAQVERENGVSFVISESPSSDQFFSLDEYLISSWNRPTLNWDLKCETDGFTRAWALQTVTGSINRSPEVDTLRKTSTALVTLTLIPLVTFTFVYTNCVEARRVGKMIQYGFIRFLTILVGIFALQATTASLKHNEENIAKLKDLEKVADCMDANAKIADE